MKLRMSPTRIIALGFLLAILVGALLLLLPFASKLESVSFLQALFTSTSATCVTGLVVLDTFTSWTLFGQIVILLLIQIGGLGLMTVITLFSFALGKRLGLYNRIVLMQAAGNMTLSGIGGLIRKIIPFAFVIEGLGAVLLSFRFIPEFGWGQGIWFSLFHSISAFCNAGFDLMGGRGAFSSMTHYLTDPFVTLTLAFLIVSGGLGFLVWRDMRTCGLKFSKYQLHTKLVLTISATLLLGGWGLFLIFEWNASMAGLTMGQKLLAAFFQSVTTRTAGFNTLELTKLSDSGNLLSNVLMLIGGSPGSTAGGIKTTTIGVLFLCTFTSARGRRRDHIFRYSLDRDMLRQASSILMIYLTIVIFAILALCAFDPIPLKDGMFEVNSAIATVGLTLGNTPNLSNPSRILLIILMYIGRLGGLSFTLIFAQKRQEPPIDRPTGKLLIG
ncbi:MAG: Trk family potassium uptake protein [Oscillospiraceae bacterium]|nr:Trk family potassium uptake protein [Oscillospiraceae bacterium]